MSPQAAAIGRFDAQELENGVGHEHHGHSYSMSSNGRLPKVDPDSGYFGEELLDPRDVLTERWQARLLHSRPCCLLMGYSILIAQHSGICALTLIPSLSRP